MRDLYLALSTLALLTACGDSNAPADVPADPCSGGSFAAPVVPPGCMLVDVDLCNRRGRVVCPDAGPDADTDARADAMPDAPADACVLECAPPPPGCRYEGTVTCSPRNCGTLVCADAGVDATASDVSASDATARDVSTSDVSASDVSASDAPAIVCGRSGEVFPTFRQECAGDGDCVVAVHQTDCCGNQRGLGINPSQRAAFDAAEAVCRPMYPRCGCPTRGILCDDDRWTLSADAVGVTCRAGRCSTFVR